jgi:ABC-type Fe3+ transport system substrate-binding protein
MNPRLAALAIACLAFACWAAARAQSFSELALDDRPERVHKLVAEARKEGTLNFYSSIPEKDVAVLAADFDRRYGIKLRLWRASSVKVLQRAVAEARANRWEFDAVSVSSPEMEALHRERLLQEVRSAHHEDLLPDAMPPHRAWVPQFLNVFVQAYNTARVRKDELPKSYAELADPKWKGRLGVEAADSEWYCGVLKELGEEQGAKLFRSIVATAGWSVRSGHSLLANLVASGEVPLALTVYSYRIEQLKSAGAPVEWFGIDPVIGRSNGVGVSRKPPHPNAALLFYEYLISDAQPLMVKMNYLAASRKAAGPLRGVNVRFLGPGTTLEELERCAKAFDDLNRSRGAKNPV